MSELEYKFTNDTLFKMLFVQYPNLLKKLVAILLDINVKNISQFYIRNPEMPPENLEDKFCRLDISMVVNDRRVAIEVQVRDEGDYSERTLYYWAREYSSALIKGGKYSDLPRTVIISILDFNHFDCDEYHSEYQALEVKRHTPLSDRLNLHFFELRKLPDRIAGDNDLELWLSLFRAKTEEELLKLEAMEVPEVNQAIDAYRSITVTPEFREAERLRSKARSDEAQALFNAERKGRTEGLAEGRQEGLAEGRQEGRQEGKQEGKREEKFKVARTLLMMEMSFDVITKATGLTFEEIMGLQNMS